MIGHLVTEMEYESPHTGTIVVKEGDVADSLYVLVKGRCGVYVQTDSTDESQTKVAILSEFDLFGESAFHHAAGGVRASPRRNASVIVESDTAELMKLMHGVFETLVESGRFGEKGERILWKARAVRLKRLNQNTSRIFAQNEESQNQSTIRDKLSTLEGGEGLSVDINRSADGHEDVEKGLRMAGEMSVAVHTGLPTDVHATKVKPLSSTDEQISNEIKSLPRPPPPPPPGPPPGSPINNQMEPTTARAEPMPDPTPKPAETAFVATIARAQMQAMGDDDRFAINSKPPKIKIESSSLPKRQYKPDVQYDLTVSGDDDQSGNWL
jgi:CRP-like cAMP-binding protein